MPPIDWNAVYNTHRTNLNNLAQGLTPFTASEETLNYRNDPNAIVDNMIADYESKNKKRIGNTNYRQALTSLAGPASTLRYAMALGQGQDPATYGSYSTNFSTTPSDATFSKFFRNALSAQQGYPTDAANASKLNFRGTNESSPGNLFGISPAGINNIFGDFVTRMNNVVGGSTNTVPSVQGTLRGMTFPELQKIQETLLGLQYGPEAASSAIRYLRPEYERLETSGMGIPGQSESEIWLNFLRLLGYTI